MIATSQLSMQSYRLTHKLKSILKYLIMELHTELDKILSEFFKNSKIHLLQLSSSIIYQFMIACCLSDETMIGGQEGYGLSVDD